MGPNAAGTMPAPTTVEVSFEFRVGLKWDMLTLHDKREQTEQGKNKALVPIRPILHNEKESYQHIIVQADEQYDIMWTQHTNGSSLWSLGCGTRGRPWESSLRSEMGSLLSLLLVSKGDALSTCAALGTAGFIEPLAVASGSLSMGRDDTVSWKLYCVYLWKMRPEE